MEVHYFQPLFSWNGTHIATDRGFADLDDCLGVKDVAILDREVVFRSPAVHAAGLLDLVNESHSFWRPAYIQIYIRCHTHTHTPHATHTHTHTHHYHHPPIQHLLAINMAKFVGHAGYDHTELVQELVMHWAQVKLTIESK